MSDDMYAWRADDVDADLDSDGDVLEQNNQPDAYSCPDGDGAEAAPYSLPPIWNNDNK